MKFKCISKIESILFIIFIKCLALNKIEIICICLVLIITT